MVWAGKTLKRKRAAVRDGGLGERVILCKRIRGGVLRRLNPSQMRDLQCVLEMRW